MERPQIHIEPEAITRASDSAYRLGSALAEKQLGAVQSSYRRRYSQGIDQFWQSQLHGSEEIGAELAALRLEAQRQFCIAVLRTVMLMGVPCGLIGAWAFGWVVGSVLFCFSFLLGIYFGSK